MLEAFESLFKGVKYEHRRSHLGDYVASFLFEDLVALGHSRKLAEKLSAGRIAVNVANVAVGKKARRGDGTLGEVVPGAGVVMVKDMLVPRGEIAGVDVGVETKVLAKAMIKQIDRVMNDLVKQVEHFKASNPRAICVALVGVNHAAKYVSFEGTRTFATDGKDYKHPIQEAAAAADRIERHVAGRFDECVMLRFSASNIRPYPFQWVDEEQVRKEYSAALARISREYDARF